MFLQQTRISQLQQRPVMIRFLPVLPEKGIDLSGTGTPPRNPVVLILIPREVNMTPF